MGEASRHQFVKNHVYLPLRARRRVCTNDRVPIGRWSSNGITIIRLLEGISVTAEHSDPAQDVRMTKLIFCQVLRIPATRGPTSLIVYVNDKAKIATSGTLSGDIWRRREKRRGPASNICYKKLHYWKFRQQFDLVI